ncbi:MAG: hypothetical protein Q7R77_01585 [Candidatus Daviesbacteria bacterium]|nr:hypothetical protein [Candidatus Daviesbacteria bacterium]
MKKLLLLFLFLLSFSFVPKVFAQNSSFVSIVNPIRGNDFWDMKDQKAETAVLGQIEILNKNKLPATWLIRFDALDNQIIINATKGRLSDEKGIFLEVTSSWANAAKVTYHKSDIWHMAGSAFLTGYERLEREKLIDAAFEKFKSIFGYFPSSIGAWWVDSYSLDYMQRKYGITGALIVADQYSTDNYQIWGQYFGTPYYPAKNNALHPASFKETKLPVVIMQWASRDPVNAYGNGVNESTFSVQANDYTDYHDLDIKYFSSLVDIYTEQKYNGFSHLVVGLENSYDWNKYGSEYRRQIEILLKKQINITTMSDFAQWYKNNFPEISPEQIVIADDPLGSFKKSVWFMNPHYRAFLFVNQEGVVFRDVRQYIEGEEELCYLKSCSIVNFATFATRVLDDVTYGNKWVIDGGGIRDFNVSKTLTGYLISYINDAGNKRKIEFLPKDIKIDEKIFTIDGAILNAIGQDNKIPKKISDFKNGFFKWSISSVFLKSAFFGLFLVLACFLPGFIFTNKLYKKDDGIFIKIFIATIIGIVLFTVISYGTSFFNIKLLVYAYIIVPLFIFFRFKFFKALNLKLQKPDIFSLLSVLMIFVGTIFQVIPVFRSGLSFPYGMGFWGPNAHDGIWHVSLINQIAKGLPADNPIFAGVILRNYHFFYDLLVAGTYNLTNIPVLDLVFRFYPLIFSIMLGIGTYYLALNLFGTTIKGKVAAIFSLYFVYFAGSFGWIADYLKHKTLGGESAFWANQSISFNLNPPFAISLLIVIAFLLIFLSARRLNRISVISILALLGGSLIGFKVYGAVLLIGSLIPIAIISLFKKEFTIFYITIFTVFLSGLIFLSNFESGQQLIIFSPFWFIHSMIDSESRIGWVKLSLARVAGLETHNWFKFIIAEIIGVVLFIVGNMGFRVLSFTALGKFPFLLFFSALSFFIPVILIQGGNPWNTIQFSYYGLYITALISGIVLSSLILSIKKALAVIIVIIVLILTPINSVTTASYYLGVPHAIISDKELEALRFLAEQPEGIILTYPYDDKLKQKLNEPWPLLAYDSTAYVAAISGKSVFVEDEGQNQILFTNYKKRLISSKDFFQNAISQKTKFLQENKISYIYLPKIYNVFLDEKAVPVKSIFENEKVKIYQRI